MMFGSVSVLGAPINKISVDYDNQCVTLIGGGFQKNESIIIEVADYNLVTKTDGVVTGIPDEAVNYIGASNADINGNIDLVFSMKSSSETGKKLLKVSSMYGMQDSQEFYFYSDEKVNSVLELFREAVEEDDDTKLKSVLNDGEAISIILQMDAATEIYNRQKEAFVASDIVSNLLDAKPPEKISECPGSTARCVCSICGNQYRCSRRLQIPRFRVSGCAWYQ